MDECDELFINPDSVSTSTKVVFNLSVNPSNVTVPKPTAFSSNSAITSLAVVLLDSTTAGTNLLTFSLMTEREFIMSR